MKCKALSQCLTYGGCCVRVAEMPMVVDALSVLSSGQGNSGELPGWEMGVDCPCHWGPSQLHSEWNWLTTLPSRGITDHSDC